MSGLPWLAPFSAARPSDARHPPPPPPSHVCRWEGITWDPTRRELYTAMSSIRQVAAGCAAVACIGSVLGSVLVSMHEVHAASLGERCSFSMPARKATLFLQRSKATTTSVAAPLVCSLLLACSQGMEDNANSGTANTRWVMPRRWCAQYTCRCCTAAVLLSPAACTGCGGHGCACLILCAARLQSLPTFGFVSLRCLPAWQVRHWRTQPRPPALQQVRLRVPPAGRRGQQQGIGHSTGPQAPPHLKGMEPMDWC